MTQSTVYKKAQQIKSNVFLVVDPSVVDSIVERHERHDLSENDALIELSRLEKGASRHSPPLDNGKVREEWGAISTVVVESERRSLKTAKHQFYVGTVFLPLFILMMMLSLWLHLQDAAYAAVVAGLAAVVVYTFFVLRIYQQASIAAERFSEKRLALLFLKFALVNSGEERRVLLEAGTSMFLGHQAPQTIPLSPNDLNNLKDVLK